MDLVSAEVDLRVCQLVRQAEDCEPVVRRQMATVVSYRLFFELLAGESTGKTHQTASTSVRPSASAKRYMVQTTD